MPFWPFKVVVAMVVASVALVPYAKPFWVASAPPVTDILAFRVKVEVETKVGSEVVRVWMQGLVVNVVSEPYPVPCELVT